MSNKKADSYKTIFFGILEQQSALNVGGRNDTSGMVDALFCRDGVGRLTIRGTTLAGSLINTARKIFGDFQSKNFIGSHPGLASNEETLQKSFWRVYTSHPVNPDTQMEYRQCVAIHQSTGAASDGSLFDMETLPRGSEWYFLMEVRTDGKNGAEAESTAAASLLEWNMGNCFIGNSVARGLGWMKLKDLKAWRLTTEHWKLWPDSSIDWNTGKIHDKLCDLLKGTHQVLCAEFYNEFALDHIIEQPGQRGNYISISGSITAGQRDNDYGLDVFTVGGHSSHAEKLFHENYLEKMKSHFIIPSKVNPQNWWKKSFDPDMPINLTKNKSGEIEPFISGSSIRGSLRHLLSRWLRAKGFSVSDPAMEQVSDDDPVGELFGTMNRSARMLVSDAYLKSTDWQAVLLQQHAEDEFTQGVYKSSKFNLIVLTRGCFEFKMVIELAENEDEKKFEDFFDYIEKMAKAGHIPLGGKQWRGAGWPQWRFEREKRETRKAGDL